MAKILQGTWMWRWPSCSCSIDSASLLPLIVCRAQQRKVRAAEAAAGEAVDHAEVTWPPGNHPLPSAAEVCSAFQVQRVDSCLPVQARAQENVKSMQKELDKAKVCYAGKDYMQWLRSFRGRDEVACIEA